MAEIVQRRMEAMTIEFEEMTRTQLFTAQESREIQKRRKEFEHKTNSVTKVLQNYKDYITYERNVFKIIKSRRNKFQIGEKKGSLEYKVINRIKTLYESAIARYANNVELCMDYFKFCKDAHYNTSVTKVMGIMLKHHSHLDQVWLLCAKYYSHERKDANSAIAVLYKGIVQNPTSSILYLEIVKLEISKAFGSDVKNELSKKPTTEVIDRTNKILKTYIESMSKHLYDSSVLLQILNYLEKYEYTMPVQNDIVDDLILKFSNDVQMWNLLALREKKGFNYGVDINQKKTPKQKLTLCFERYKEGLQKISDANKPSLWLIYLDFLVDLCEIENSVANQLKITQCKEAFKEASDLGFLTDKHYIKWLEFVTDGEAYELLKIGTEKLPISRDLWSLRLRYAIMMENEGEMNIVYDLGVKALEDDAYPLFSSLLKYHMLTSNEDKVCEFFKEAVANKYVSQKAKPRFIEWLALNKGVEAARQVYAELSIKEPFCKELLETMYTIETTQTSTLPGRFDVDPKVVKTWEAILLLMIKQFGTKDWDVWINYVKFIKHYYFEIDFKERVLLIATHAKVALSDLDHLKFQEQYNALIWF